MPDGDLEAGSGLSGGKGMIGKCDEMGILHKETPFYPFPILQFYVTLREMFIIAAGFSVSLRVCFECEY